MVSKVPARSSPERVRVWAAGPSITVISAESPLLSLGADAPGLNRRVPRGGGGPGRGLRAEEHPPGVCAGAAQDPLRPLAGHHRGHQHGLLPALRPQCGERPCMVGGTGRGVGGMVRGLGAGGPGSSPNNVTSTSSVQSGSQAI